jgi:hypothetical protein
MHTYVRVIVASLGLLAVASSASAQYWGRGAYPGSGVCFYEDINYGGRYFCTRVGDNNPRVGSAVNDEISSLRLFGNAEVIIFRDPNMRGESRRFTSGVRDLRYAGFNDRLSSYVVQRRNYNGNWGGAYGGGGYGGGSGGGYGGGYNGGYGGGGYNGGYGGAYGGGSHWGGSNNNGGSRWTYAQAENMVRQAYRRVFRREPDPAARPWVNEVMKNNWSQRQLENALRDTPEGRQR